MTETTETTMSWYIVQTYSGFENKVKLALEQRIIQNKLDRFFEEVFIPTETVVEMRNGKRREVKRKFYNGYIFVKMFLNDDTWHCVNNTSKVVGFLGNERNPAPVPESEVKQITQRIEDGEMKPTIRVSYERGQKVKVTDGQFNGFEGWVEDVEQDKGRLHVMVEIFGRPTRTAFEFDQVSPIEE